MELKRWSLPIRILIAVVVAFGMLMFIYSGAPRGGELDPGRKFMGLILAAFYGFILFALFGWPMITKVGDKFASLYVGDEKEMRLLPEYSTAEARVSTGRYQEAVDEYRKVIEEYPEDVYPHLRIAELAIKHLNDVNLGELELLSALGKAAGNDTTALASGRLADFYQMTLNDPARALEVMKQLRDRIPGTKQAALAEERIAILEKIAIHGEVVPEVPKKLTNRPSRYKMTE